MKITTLFIPAILILAVGCDQPRSLEETESAGANLPSRDIENPFPNASQVRLFVEVSYTEDGGPILSNAEGIPLTDVERAQFEDTLKFVAAPEYMAACFIPHHFFRYFGSNGEQLGEVEVCFCCAGVAAAGSNQLIERSGEMLSADYHVLEKLISKLGEPTDVMCDEV